MSVTTAPTSPEQAPGQTKTPEAVTPSPTQARADLLTEVQREQLKKLEEEKATKERRRLALETESQSGKNQEGWVNRDKGSGALDGAAQSMINGTVESKFDEKSAEFAKYGVTGANLAIMKQAAKDLVFDHYCKNGRDQDITKAWVKDTLTPKMLGLLEKMQKIMNDPKYGFKTPLEVLQSFSDFAKLNLLSGGTLGLGGVKNFIVLDQASFDLLSKNFEEYLSLGTDINKLNTDIAKITPAQPGTPTAQPGTPPPQPTTPTTQPPTTPPNIPASTPPATPAPAPASPEAAPPAPVKPPETPTAQQQPAQAPTAAPAPAAAPGTSPTAAPPAKPQEPEEIKTGIAFIDTILGFIKTLSPGLYASLGTFLKSLGVGKAKEEFAGLDDNQKGEALVLKEMTKTYGLKAEIMAVLFTDGEQTKRVLKNKTDNQIPDWETYLKSFLNGDEQQQLQTNTNLKAPEIAELLLTKVEAGQKPVVKPL